MKSIIEKLSKYFETKQGIIALIIAFILVVILEKILFGNSYARELLPLDTSEYLRGGLSIAPQGMSGQKMAIDFTLRNLGYVKTIVAVIGVLMITIQGVRLIYSQGVQEDLTKVKDSLTYIVIAFVFLSMGQEIAKIFDMSSGSLIDSPANMIKHVQLFDRQVQVLITFIKHIIGAVATLNLVIAGIKFATAGGETEVVETQKKRIYYSIAGLVMIYLGEIGIDKVFYVLDKRAYSGITGAKPYIDVREGIAQVIGVTNFVVSFLGVLCVLMLVYGALLYAFSGGNEDQMSKAKKVLITTFVGMIIIFASFSIVSTIIMARL